MTVTPTGGGSEHSELADGGGVDEETASLMATSGGSSSSSSIFGLSNAITDLQSSEVVRLVMIMLVLGPKRAQQIFPLLSLYA